MTVHIIARRASVRWKALRAYWRAAGQHMAGEPLWFRAFVRFWAVVSWIQFCWFVRGLPRLESKP